MDAIVDKAVHLLAALNVTPDETLLSLCADGVLEQLLAATNRDTLPDGMLTTAAWMVAGEYMRFALASGRLEAESVDLTAPVLSSLKMGDTQWGYDAASTPAGRVSALCDRLTQTPDDLIYRYRRLLW